MGEGGYSKRKDYCIRNDGELDGHRTYYTNERISEELYRYNTVPGIKWLDDNEDMCHQAATHPQKSK